MALTQPGNPLPLSRESITAATLRQLRRSPLRCGANRAERDGVACERGRRFLSRIDTNTGPDVQSQG